MGIGKKQKSYSADMKARVALESMRGRLHPIVATSYTRSKIKPGFQIAAGAHSSYVTRAIWKALRTRFYFGMGIHKGYSFVVYISAKDAQAAIGGLDGFEMRPKKLKVSFARSEAFSKQPQET